MFCGTKGLNHNPLRYRSGSITSTPPITPQYIASVAKSAPSRRELSRQRHWACQLTAPPAESHGAEDERQRNKAPSTKAATITSRIYLGDSSTNPTQSKIPQALPSPSLSPRVPAKAEAHRGRRWQGSGGPSVAEFKLPSDRPTATLKLANPHSFSRHPNYILSS